MTSSLKQMCEAGMALRMLTENLKTDNDAISFDTKAYLIDKLDEAFFSIQADISLAVANHLGEVVTDIMNEEEEGE